MSLVTEWLHKLNLQDTKVTVTDHRLSTDKLSQGQRKRLAMLLAVTEQKDFLLLDEWAAAAKTLLFAEYFIKNR